MPKKQPMSEDESESEEEEEIVVKRRYKKKRDPDDLQYRPDFKVPSKPKPQGAPKRPQSAYFLFLADKRDTIKEEHPEWKIGEVTKAVSGEWKELDTTEKEKYQEEAKELLDAYHEERAEYIKSNKYKRYKKDLEEWNDLYRDEWDEQQEEKKRKREENKKKKKKSKSSSPKKKKATSTKKGGKKTKST